MAAEGKHSRHAASRQKRAAQDAMTISIYRSRQGDVNRDQAMRLYNGTSHMLKGSVLSQGWEAQSSTCHPVQRMAVAPKAWPGT